MGKVVVYLDARRSAATAITEALLAKSFVLQNDTAIRQKTGSAPNFLFRKLTGSGS